MLLGLIEEEFNAGLLELWKVIERDIRTSLNWIWEELVVNLVVNCLVKEPVNRIKQALVLLIDQLV